MLHQYKTTKQICTKKLLDLCHVKHNVPVIKYMFPAL